MAGYTPKVLGALLLLLRCAAWCLATEYNVGGDSSGWTTGVDYTTWASDKSFVVGDTLAFYYGRGQHTVDEVSVSDYHACSATHYISRDSSGVTMVVLKTAGAHYFVCGMPGHCSRGMKVAVMVGAAAAASSSSPASPAYSSAVTVGTPAPALMTVVLSVIVLLKLRII